MMKKALIVFGEDWGRHPSSTQHLIKHLSQERPVVWVNSIGLRFPRLNGRDLKRAWHKLKQLLTRQTTSKAQGVNVPEHIKVVNPWVLPPCRNALLRWLNRSLLSWQLNRVCGALGIKERDLWISLPSAVDCVGRLSEDQVIYYCGDDFSALAGVDHDYVSECEVTLMNRAHHVLVASQALWTKFAGLREWQSKLMLLEHGVDLELFSGSCSRAEPLKGKKPIAGFYGSIAEWLDLPLLAKVAAALPNWRFVLIGNIETDISAIKTVSNIEIYPAVAHANLPSFAQHWQVALLPFRDCGQIQACNPLKLKEYLATGQPVISTPFPAVDHYRKVVDIVRNSHEFIEAIRRCEQPHCYDASQQAARQASVAKHSWQAKAAQLNQLLA